MGKGLLRLGVRLIAVECRSIYRAPDLQFIGLRVIEENLDLSVIGGKDDLEQARITAEILGAGYWTTTLGEDGLLGHMNAIRRVCQQAEIEPENVLVVSYKPIDGEAALQLGCQFQFPTVVVRAILQHHSIGKYLESLSGR